MLRARDIESLEKMLSDRILIINLGKDYKRKTITSKAWNFEDGDRKITLIHSTDSL